jgi:hypothetical protein
MNDELVERLREQRPNGECITVARLMDEAADRIEALTAEVQRLDYSTTHTCWDECPRLPCAQRREIEALTARAEAAEARNKVLEEALRVIRSEAQRENGSWVHIKRCIAVQSAQALGGEHD